MTGFKARRYKGHYDGEDHDLSINKWSKLLGRSHSFVDNRIREAKGFGYKRPAMYAVSESIKLDNKRENNIAYNLRKRHPSSFIKTGIEELYVERHKSIFNSFLLPKGVELSLKREGWQT